MFVQNAALGFQKKNKKKWTAQRVMHFLEKSFDGEDMDWSLRSCEVSTEPLFTIIL